MGLTEFKETKTWGQRCWGLGLRVLRVPSTLCLAKQARLAHYVFVPRHYGGNEIYAGYDYTCSSANVSQWVCTRRKNQVPHIAWPNDEPASVNVLLLLLKKLV